MTTRPPALDNNYFGSAAHLAATEATTRNMVHAAHALNAGPGSITKAVFSAFGRYRDYKNQTQRQEQQMQQPQPTYLTTEMALQFMQEGFTEKDQIIEELDAAIAERDAEITQLREQLAQAQQHATALRVSRDKLWMSDAAHGLVARVLAATLNQIVEHQPEIATYVAWTLKNTLNFHNAYSKVYGGYSLEEYLANADININDQAAIKRLFDGVNKTYKRLELRLEHYQVAEEIKKGNSFFKFKPVSSFEHYVAKAKLEKDQGK